MRERINGITAGLYIILFIHMANYIALNFKQTLNSIFIFTACCSLENLLITYDESYDLVYVFYLILIKRGTQTFADIMLVTGLSHIVHITTAQFVEGPH